MSLIDNFTEEQIIDGFVQKILDEDPDFSFMSEDEQKSIYGIYTLLITLVIFIGLFEQILKISWFLVIFFCINLFIIKHASLM